MIRKIDSFRTVVEIIVAAWIIIAACYLIHTPIEQRAHDFWGHVDYTVYLVKNRKLPTPFEWWEAHQAPLYYFLVSFIDIESTKSDRFHHINYVRVLSVFFGVVSLIIVTWFLEKFKFSRKNQLLTLLFLATTPKFVFTFTSYNNDTLAILLSLGLIAVSYELYHNWSLVLLLLLLIIATAGLYTKLSFGIVTATILIVYFKKLLEGKLEVRKCFLVVLSLLTSVFLLLPWLINHNYKLTGNLIPSVVSVPGKKFDLVQLKDLLGIVFRIPALQINKPDLSHEWDDPFCHPYFERTSPATKRYDYLAFMLITSVIDEQKHITPDVNVIWYILLFHLISCFLGLTETFKTNECILSGFSILTAYVLSIVFILSHYAFLATPNVDFRYISWTWLPWSILYANKLSSKGFSSDMLRFVFYCSIVLHVYFLLTVSSVWE